MVQIAVGIEAEIVVATAEDAVAVLVAEAADVVAVVAADMAVGTVVMAATVAGVGAGKTHFTQRHRENLNADSTRGRERSRPFLCIPLLI